MTPEQLIAITKLLQHHTIVRIGDDKPANGGFMQGAVDAMLEDGGKAVILRNGSVVFFDFEGKWRTTTTLKELR
jgi:hypothetical protein